MDRQSPLAPSLLFAVLATAIWAFLLWLTPLPRVPLTLGLLSLGVIAFAQLAPVRLVPSPFRWGAALLGLMAGGATLALTHVLAPATLSAVPSWAAELATLSRGAIAESPYPLALTVVLIVLVVIGEELVWRGLALSALRARAPEAVAVVGAALLYALAQLGFGAALPVVAAFGLGLVWSVLRIVTGGLVASAVAHLVWTSGILWLWPVLPVP